MKKYISWTLMFVCLLMILPFHVQAATNENLGVTTSGAVASSGTDVDASDGKLSMKVSGSNDTGTLTLMNNETESAILTFTYLASGNVSSCAVDGTAVTKDQTGEYSKEIAAGSSITITLTVTQKSLFSGNRVATISLTGVSLAVPQASKLTLSYSEGGSVSVGGAAISSGAIVDVEATGTTLTATPDSGATFIGWIDPSNNSVVSTASSFAYKPISDAALRAVFASPSLEARFWGSNRDYLFEGLSAAISYASGASDKVIVLASNGTLFAGDYIVPSGVTLLMPFDSAGTCYKDIPGCNETGWTSPSPYYTMTMADGANITVNGAISVSAKVSGKQGASGNPDSKYGHIAMNAGSSITVNNGANLYVWGYITGSGNVTIKSGGTVHEAFQAVDWRGGTYTTKMIDNSQKVFPITQYYVQNVEAPMTLESGALEKCCLSAVISSFLQQKTVPFFGKTGHMFNITSGSVTKRYDGSTDRTIFDINGNFNVGNISIVMVEGVNIFGYQALRVEIKSENYVLPVSNNVTLNVNSGHTMTINQSLSLLPGVKVNIAENASVTLGSGKQFFVYDDTEWEKNKYVYAAAYFRPVPYAPSKTHTRTLETDIIDAEIIVNGTVDATAGYVYTTAGGANIRSDGTGVVKLRATQNATLNETVQTTDDPAYESIPITAAKLKNADGSYQETAAKANVFKYTNGKWVCEADASVEGSGHDDTTTPDHNCDICGLVNISTCSQNEGTPVEENRTEPGCETQGFYDEVYYCTVCGQQSRRILKYLEATGHKDEEPADHTCDTCNTEDITECGIDENSDFKCDICGAGLCDHTEKTHAPAVDATCEGRGTKEYWQCNTCAAYFTDEACTAPIENFDAWVTAEGEGFIAPIGHAYAIAENGYVWAEDYSKATATGVCANDAEHSKTAESSESTNAHTDPTCSAPGSDVYTVTFVEDKEFTNLVTELKKTVELPIVDGAHAWDDDCDTTCNNNAAHTREPEHDYDVVVTTPTCTEGGCTTYTCRVCGHTTITDNVAATGHSYTSEVTTPTCEAEGYTTHTCACGDSYTDSEVKATGHSYTSEVTKAPTCTVAGVKTFTCSACGDTYTEEVAATGHTEGSVVVENNVGATCEAEGSYDNVVYCTECNEELDRETITVDKLDHTEGEVVVENEVGATCEAEGSYDNVTYCTVCNAETSRETITVDALGHTEETVAGKDATCTEPGLTEGKKCTVCGETTVAQETIPANGHTEETVAGKEATCTEPGLTEGKKCTVCGVTTVAQEEIGTLGHTEETVAGKDATCTATGLTDGVKCSVCNETLTAQEEIEALGHTEETVAGKEATCTETGLTDGVKCSVCGDILTAQETIPAKGHTDGDVVVENEVDATCTAEGSYDNVVYCTECNEELDRETITVDKLAHTEEIIPAVAATCTEPGLTDGVKCSVCGDILTAQETIPANGHTEVVDEAVAPKCEETGLTEGKHCETCDEVIKAQEVVAALGHKYEATVTAPTCEDKGYTTYKCSACGDTYTGNEVAAKGHDMQLTEAAVEATCDTAGSTAVYTCANGCNKTEGGEPIEAKGHNEESHEAKAPTCTEIGWNAYVTCSRCEYTTYAEKAALGHTAATDAAKAPTCTETGLTEGSHCDICGEILVAQTVVPAQGHSYTSEVTAPTCEAKGYTTYTCAVCGDTYKDDYVDALDHTAGEPTQENIVAATCTEDGSYELATYCTVCKEELSRETITTAHQGHKAGALVVENSTPATCTTAGYYENVTYCTVCKEEISRVPVTIPATGEHTYENGTCTGCGAVEGFAVTFEDKNVLSEDTAKISLVENAFYKPGDKFTVTSDKACVVAIYDDDKQAYTELSCVAKGDNTYEFTIPTTVDSAFKIGIVLRGDATGDDGVANIYDATRVARFCTRGLTGNNTLDSLTKLAADATKDGVVNIYDATRIARYCTRGLKENNTLEWNVVLDNAVG